MEDTGKGIPPPDGGVTPTGDPTGIKTIGTGEMASAELGTHSPPEEPKGYVGAANAAGGEIESSGKPKMPASGSNPDVYDN